MRSSSRAGFTMANPLTTTINKLIVSEVIMAIEVCSSLECHLQGSSEFFRKSSLPPPSISSSFIISTHHGLHDPRGIQTATCQRRSQQCSIRGAAVAQSQSLALLQRVSRPPAEGGEAIRRQAHSAILRAMGKAELCTCRGMFPYDRIVRAAFLTSQPGDRSSLSIAVKATWLPQSTRCQPTI
jgi:hypothetical protein